MRDALVEAFHGPALRVYANDDIVGVEVGGAVKNVLAIATGLCDGLGLGLNARAALITRGLAEMTRLGVALGARRRHLHGPVGPGRPGAHRHRRPEPQPPGRPAAGAGPARCSRRWIRWATWPRACTARAPWCSAPRCLGVEMPIAQGVVALLDGQLKPDAAVAALMGREPTHEQL